MNMVERIKSDEHIDRIYISNTKNYMMCEC